MSLVKELGKNLIGISVALGITTGALTGINFYTHHNVIYKTENKEVFQKADGVLSYLELTVNKDNSKEIKRHSIINSKCYKDINNNGKVEKFIQWYHPLNRGPALERFDENELTNNPELSKDVNKDFRKYLRKFR